MLIMEEIEVLLDRIMRRKTILLIVVVATLIGLGIATISQTQSKHQNEIHQLKQQNSEQLKRLEDSLFKSNDELKKIQESEKQKDQKINDLEAQLVAKAEARKKAEEARLAASHGPGVSISGGSGSCEAEIAKYPWPQSTALAVMRKESSGNPGIVNDNPATGDYSVGCFQINLYGANAASRPSEAELKNAAVNVAFAYKLYLGAGGFCTRGGWFNTCNYLGIG